MVVRPARLERATCGFEGERTGGNPTIPANQIQYKRHDLRPPSWSELYRFGSCSRTEGGQ
jgi:hypothetical protein